MSMSILLQKVRSLIKRVHCDPKTRWEVRSLRTGSSTRDIEVNLKIFGKSEAKTTNPTNITPNIEDNNKRRKQSLLLSSRIRILTLVVNTIVADYHQLDYFPKQCLLRLHQEDAPWSVASFKTTLVSATWNSVKTKKRMQSSRKLCKRSRRLWLCLIIVRVAKPRDEDPLLL